MTFTPMPHELRQERTALPRIVAWGHTYIPMYLVTGAIMTLGADLTVQMRIVLVLFWVYLLPPLLCRVILLCFGFPTAGVAHPESKVFKVWWWLAQIQIPFNRIMALEEALRLIPGAYSLWLKLWGSEVSVEAYWSPAVFVTDRYLLRIGKGVVLGSRSIIAGHAVTGNGSGEYLLTVAPVTIGAHAIIGALAIVSPGCLVHENETIPMGRLLPPFTTWKFGRKERSFHGQRSFSICTSHPR